MSTPTKFEWLKPIFDALYVRLVDCAQRITGDRAEAEDAAQVAQLNTMLAAGKKTVHNLEAYLFTATRRAAYRLVSARRRMQQLDPVVGNVLPGRLEQDEPVELPPFPTVLEMVPDRLTRDILCFKAGGDTYEEIGEAVGKSAGACRTIVCRALAKLKLALSPVS